MSKPNKQRANSREIDLESLLSHDKLMKNSSTDNQELKRQFINSMRDCPEEESERVLSEIIDYIVD